jgi:hypothetical protein
MGIDSGVGISSKVAGIGSMVAIMDAKFIPTSFLLIFFWILFFFVVIAINENKFHCMY